MSDAKQVFISKVPKIAEELQSAFPSWGALECAAACGNGGHESRGFTALQEEKPTVKGSAGGYGWYQWTGPRRRAFVAWCKKNGLDATSDDANIGFLIFELEGPEKRTIADVKSAVGLEAKVKAFENAFERAGVKAYASRITWARLALDTLAPNGVEPATIVSQVNAPTPTQGLGLSGRLFGWLKPSKAGPAPSLVPLGADPVVWNVQGQLLALGYTEVGMQDGKAGPRLGDGVAAFRRDNDLPDSEDIDDAVLAALPKATKRVVSAARGAATAQDLAKAGNQPVQSFNLIGLATKGILGFSGLGAIDQTGVLDSIKSTADTAQGTLASVTSVVTSVVGVFQWALHHWWIFGIGGGLYVLYHVVSGVLDIVVKFRQGFLTTPK